MNAINFIQYFYLARMTKFFCRIIDALIELLIFIYLSIFLSAVDLAVKIVHQIGM
jgi:hypothetical protein